MTRAKRLIVGEQNPYGGDDHSTLYPAPDGCSGHRLCCLILGMHRKDYLEQFQRVNLVQGPWRIGTARARAEELRSEPGPFILCGKKVCDAWGVPFTPFEVTDETTLVIPHPSGLNHLWARPGIIDQTRAAVVKLHPELTQFIGAAEMSS